MIVTMFGSHIGDQILEIGKSANQFTIFVYKSQGQRRLAKNNLDSCIRITNMMRESFYLMRSEMSQFREEGDPPPESDGSGKIIRLADYQRRK
ncbi:MAG: DUF3135 domain-containing protein [Aeromonas veronii]